MNDGYRRLVLFGPNEALKAHDRYTRSVQYSTVRIIVTIQLIVYPFNSEYI